MFDRAEKLILAGVAVLLFIVAFAFHGADAHELTVDECTFIAYTGGWAAQDRNRGLTEQASIERHLDSIHVCQAESQFCAFKDKEDVDRAVNMIHQTYTVPTEDDGKVDPRAVFSQIMTQCKKIAMAKRNPHADD